MNTTELGFEVTELEVPGARHRYYVVEGMTLRLYATEGTSPGATPEAEPERLMNIDKLGEFGWFEVVTIYVAVSMPATTVLRAAIAILFGVTSVEQVSA